MGSRCRLRCRKGYRPDNSAGIKKLCQNDATWTGGHGTCIPVTCPGLAPPMNGYVTPTSCSAENGTAINTRY